MSTSELQIVRCTTSITSSEQHVSNVTKQLACEIGSDVMYRYHRRDQSYRGRVVSILDGKRVVVELESGAVITRYLSSFDMK